MVIETLEGTILGFIALVAAIAAIAGIVVLEGFFRGRLKELFDDANYFIFFFMVVGYFLYALGEVSFYFTKVHFKYTQLVGIQDLYWTAGALLIAISFLALAISLYRSHRQSGALATMGLVGAILLAVVLSILFLFTPRHEYTFGYVYPVMSAVIVTLALSVFLFQKHLADFGKALQVFFLASSGILLGDIFFSFTPALGSYGTVALIADLFYLAGYGLSAAAFITLRRSMHAAASGK